MNRRLLSLAEEKTPPPNEENPGAVLCVDTNGTAPRVPLNVHLNPGILTNGELRLEGPLSSQVRVWNHFTETNAANIVTLPFITNLASSASISTNFFVQALEPSATPTNLLFQLIFSRNQESVDDKAVATALGVAKVIATGEGDSADSTAEAPGNFLVSTTNPTNHIALEAIFQPAVTSAPPNFVWNAVRLDSGAGVPSFTNNTLRTSFRRNLAGTYRVSAGCGSTNGQSSVELHIYGEDFHTCSVSCTLHGLPEFFCLGVTHEIGLIITGAEPNTKFIARFKNGNVKFVTEQGGQEVLSQEQTFTWPPPAPETEVKFKVRAVNIGEEKLGVFEDGKPEKPDPDYGILQNKTELGGPGVQRDERKTTVIKVESVRLEKFEGNEDLGNNEGGVGTRIFPDKENPDDANAADRRKVKVIAKITPAVPGALLFFKSFDVDDPDPHGIDSSGVIDTTGAAGNDNNVEAGERAGHLSALDATTDDNGEAEVELTVTMQPGDNFRVGVSCDLAALESLTVDDPISADFVPASNEQMTSFHGALSDMLTVWRRLHLEVDSMSSPANVNKVNTLIKKIDGSPTQGARKLHTTLDFIEDLQDRSPNLSYPPSGVTRSVLDPDGHPVLVVIPPGTGRFENGDARIGSADGVTTTFGFLGNGKKFIESKWLTSSQSFDIPVVLTSQGGVQKQSKLVFMKQKTLKVEDQLVPHAFINGTIRIAGGVPKTITANSVHGVVLDHPVGIPIELHDDDNDDSLPNDPDTSWLAPALAEAYILPLPDLPGSHTVTPVINVNTAIGALPVADWNSRGKCDQNYWVAYILGGFQGDRFSIVYDPQRDHIRTDHDPNDERHSILGIANPNTGGSVIFFETLSDYNFNRLSNEPFMPEANVVQHELGHILGRSGIEQITRYDSDDSTPARYQPMYIRMIRILQEPPH